MAPSAARFPQPIRSQRVAQAGESTRKQRENRKREGRNSALPFMKTSSDPALPPRPPTTTAPISRQRMFAARIMARIANVASSVPRLVAVEVIERLRPTLGKRSVVSVVRVKPVVDMPVETPGSMEPRPRSDEQPAHKPVRPIVAIGCAVIRWVVEIPIRTNRRRPNIDADRNLGRCMRWRHQNTTQQRSGKTRENKTSYLRHTVSLPHSDWTYSIWTHCDLTGTWNHCD
jgi:hypothetical protein